MNIYFNQSLASNYTSRSQIARVLTEEWAKENLYCPRCGNPRLKHFENNRKVADFYCEACKNEFELKSKAGQIGRKISDGAYDTFIQRIMSYNNPDFFVMSYSPEEMCVENLWMIPKHFFTPTIVEKRKPLSPDARRSGWTGCNILFSEVPQQGRIGIVQNRVEQTKAEVLSNVEKVSTLASNSFDARGWLFDVMNCMNRIPKETFSLNDIYLFEQELQARHPQNHNIRPKIRQQLQVLRDKGFIEFLGDGYYRKK